MLLDYYIFNHKQDFIHYKINNYKTDGKFVALTQSQYNSGKKQEKLPDLNINENAQIKIDYKTNSKPER